MPHRLKRREFISLLGGVAASSASWPLTARAQSERMRRIGVLMSTAADDPESQRRFVAFVQGLQQAGWAVGQNLQLDTRWASGDVARLRSQTTEMLALSPDIIVVGGRAATVVPQVRQAGSNIPIVFVQGVDPVGTGYVASLARPGGNATGFTQFEYTLSGKWLELLREAVPGITRAAVLREIGGAGIGQWAVLQAAASSPPVELSPVNAGEPAEIERAIAVFAGEPNGALIVVVSSWATVHRDLVIALAAKHRLPAIYPYRYFVADGGLMSYGTDLIDQYRRAAGYVDRILKGEKPADLPVQNPTRYELAINLKTAKALGLVVPQTLIARADEVIE
jgi:putative tryptophan/tyrosine transport system substrate-binding protein